MIDVIQIIKNVLTRLSIMDYEKLGGSSPEQLIFPVKIQANGTKHIKRISEQELRFLFIEEFKKQHPSLYYSIETPTSNKYCFGQSYDDIGIDKHGQSASLDMCVFERIGFDYKRIVNIEFKHKNTDPKKIAKDILKLFHEEQNGIFILLLDNTNSGTFYKQSGKGFFYKLFQAFCDFQDCWHNPNKSIHLIIISLKQKTIIHRIINKNDLENLKDIFFLSNGCGNINQIYGNGWKND